MVIVAVFALGWGATGYALGRRQLLCPNHFRHLGFADSVEQRLAYRRRQCRQPGPRKLGIDRPAVAQQPRCRGNLDALFLRRIEPVRQLGEIAEAHRRLPARAPSEARAAPLPAMAGEQRQLGDPRLPVHRCTVSGRVVRGLRIRHSPRPAIASTVSATKPIAPRISVETDTMPSLSGSTGAAWAGTITTETRS